MWYKNSAFRQQNQQQDHKGPGRTRLVQLSIIGILLQRISNSKIFLMPLNQASGFYYYS